MSPLSPPTAGLPSTKTSPKDPRHASKFSKFSACNKRIRALLCRSEKRQPDVSHSLSNLFPADMVDAQIGSRSYGRVSPFEDPKRSYNRSQNLVLPSDAYIPQLPSQSMASAFHGANEVSFSGSSQFLNVGNIINQYTATYGLETMKEFVSFNALYDSSAQDPLRKCHPGTRESILKQMFNWIDNPNTSHRILWLHGPAGVGKSAIAQTVAHPCSLNKVVAATFFFFRSDPTRNDGNRLFPTIAWQLAKYIPGARSCIADALNDDPDIPRKAIEVQFKHLISQPLQSTPGAMPQNKKPTPVVIIDGVDECLDEKLQERLINILGEAVAADSRIPLRFMISSRPEALIKDAFERFRHITLQIDLATADEAYRDVEKYFKDEFARIASKQGIDDTWPGARVIQDLTSRSSGQFVYASTVIKFVGYDYDSAPSQLDIILGLEPNDGKAPFAELDTLYLEILRRQPEQEFLKDFLALLLAQCDYTDYGLLLKVSSKAVLRKLRGMHSVLKTEPEFDVHHRSFLDFLQEASRSRQYYLNKRTATRRYLDLIVNALVRYTTKVLKQPDYHGHEHISPKFGESARDYPRWIDLPLEDWEESLVPLFMLKKELLKSGELSPSWKRGSCKGCSALYTIDDLLLHLTFYRGISSPQLSKRERGTAASFHSEVSDQCLSSLLRILRNRQASTSSATIDSLCAVLHLDPMATALQLQAVSDAQNLIDFIRSTTNKLQSQHGYSMAQRGTLLAMEIFARIPLLPQSFLYSSDVNIEGEISRGTLRYHGKYQGRRVVIKRYGDSGINSLSQTALILGTLSHDSIPPLLGVYEMMPGPVFALVFSYEANCSLRSWRKKMNPSVIEIQEHLRAVAKALQYMHSLGSVLDTFLRGENIDLDSNLHIRLPPFWLSLSYCRRIPPRYKTSNILQDPTEFHTHERGVFMYGCLLYEIFLDTDIPIHDYIIGRSRVTEIRPDKPKIDDKAWKLIQRCCANGPKERPTMAQVVEEMDSWENA